jgi:CRISPR-associated protein Cmr2
MGHRAKLSAGAVVAHHTAPLGAVLRELRAAEKRAKAEEGGGRDAFSITLMKRSGGVAQFTSKWLLGDTARPDLDKSAVARLIRLRDALAKHLSRRAAYHILERLPGLPPDASDEMLKATLVYQFERQKKEERGAEPVAGVKGGEGRMDTSALAEDLLHLGREPGRRRLDVIRDALTLAEFLAREGRVERKEKTRERVSVR